MAEGIIKTVISKLENKFVPRVTNTNTIFTPQEQYRLLYNILDVWGQMGDDPHIQEQVKYIDTKLRELNKDKPQEQLISILTDLGATKWNDSKVDRIYRYFHLREEADKALNFHNLLNKEIDELRGNK